MSENFLEKLDAATRMLAECKTVHDAKKIMALADAAKIFAKRMGLGEEAEAHAHTIKVDAMAMLGDMLKATERATAGRHKKISSPGEPIKSTPTLEEIGVTKKESFAARKLSTAKAERPEVFQAVRSGEMPIKAAASKTVHVSNNSGNNEWYTPPEYIEAAREVLGKIDCDPASSEKANKTVKAKKIHTLDRDGIGGVSWGKRVWMNPPYAQPACANFCKVLAGKVKSGEVEEAVVLVNNATETEWFSMLIEHAAAVMFPRGRIKFIDENGSPGGTPLQGQALIYIGKKTKTFCAAFSKFGWIAIVHV